MTHANVSSKTCFKCGNVKARTDFYKHPAMGDGLIGKCKTCTKSDASTYRLENLEKIRDYDKTRSNLPHRKSLALELQRLRRKLDARKDSCHSKVLRAVAQGRLKRMPCGICGSVKSMAHHESYERPLDVVWYCQVHHKARHREMAIEGIDP